MRPDGREMVLKTALDWDKLSASLAVMVAANAYMPIRDRIGMTTRRKILRRIDRRRKPMAVASA
jgi:hypothetical protein